MYKRSIAICLLFAIAAATLACGETEQTTNETDAQSTTAVVDSFYDNLDEDYDGYEPDEDEQAMDESDPFYFSEGMHL